MWRRSHTTVIERDRVWDGGFETEPCEAGWAGEALFFVRTLEAEAHLDNLRARVQISPDGLHWCDEGTELRLGDTAEVTFAKVSGFGTYLRLVGELPDGVRLRVIVYVALKE